MPFVEILPRNSTFETLEKDVQSALLEAIARAAKSRLLHLDLLYRHIGTISRPNKKLKVVFIDLARVEAHESEDFIYQTMLQNLNIDI
jgi:hypothetical protein